MTWLMGLELTWLSFGEPLLLLIAQMKRKRASANHGIGRIVNVHNTIANYQFPPLGWARIKGLKGSLSSARARTILVHVCQILALALT